MNRLRDLLDEVAGLWYAIPLVDITAERFEDLHRLVDLAKEDTLRRRDAYLADNRGVDSDTPPVLDSRT